MIQGENQISTENKSNSTLKSDWTFPDAPPYMPGALPYLFVFFSQQRTNSKSQKTAEQTPNSCVLF